MSGVRDEAHPFLGSDGVDPAALDRLSSHAHALCEGEAWAGASRPAAPRRRHRHRPGALRAARRGLEAGAVQRLQAPAGGAGAALARRRQCDPPRAGGLRRGRFSARGDRASRAFRRQCGNRLRGRGRAPPARHRFRRSSRSSSTTPAWRVSSRSRRWYGATTVRRSPSSAACSGSSSFASRGRRRWCGRRSPVAASGLVPWPAPPTSAPAGRRATSGVAAPRRRGARREIPRGR